MKNQFFGESLCTYNFNISWFNKVSANINLVIDTSRQIQGNTKHILFFFALDSQKIIAQNFNIVFLLAAK